jgi:hypothetical protein
MRAPFSSADAWTWSELSLSHTQHATTRAVAVRAGARMARRTPMQSNYASYASCAAPCESEPLWRSLLGFEERAAWGKPRRRDRQSALGGRWAVVRFVFLKGVLLVLTAGQAGRSGADRTEGGRRPRAPVCPAGAPKAHPPLRK